MRRANDIPASMVNLRIDVAEQFGANRLKILEEANLVSVHWRGREKLHFINPIPLAEIVHRWVGRFEDARLEMLVDLKTHSEIKQEKRNGL